MPSFRSKTVGTGERVANPNYREPDEPFTDKSGMSWNKKHTGYGTRDYLAETWTRSKRNLVTADYYKVAEGKDPGATPEHQRGAYGFAHMDRQHITTGRRYETLADPDQPLYEYEQAGAVRGGRSGGLYGRGSGFGEDDGEIHEAEIVDDGESGNRGGPRHDTVEGEYVPEAAGSLSAGGFRSQGDPAMQGVSALPFRRNDGTGIDSAKRALSAGPIALGPASAERTEGGAIPMGEGGDNVPGFNTGGVSNKSGSRRGAKRPRSGMNPNFSLAGASEEARSGGSAYEKRAQAYSNILKPPPSAAG